MGACQCTGLSPSEQMEVIPSDAAAFEFPGQPDSKEEEPSSGNEAGVRLPPNLLRTAHLTLSFIKKLQAGSSARKTAEESSECLEPDHPDFSGDWLLHRIEGDPEALLKEVGASWVQRKAAAAMAFGVGRQHVHVEQHPDSIRVETRYREKGGAEMAFPKPTNNFYTTGGEAQDTVDPEGRTIRNRVHWDEQKLLMTSERVGDEVPLPSTRRYMQDEGEEPELVFEQHSTSTGVFVRRIYRRYEKPEADGAKSVRSAKSRKSTRRPTEISLTSVGQL